VIHRFVPGDVTTAKATGDGRNWASALAANASALDAFVADLQAAGATSFDTDFVRTGTTLDVIKSRALSAYPARLLWVEIDHDRLPVEVRQRDGGCRLDLGA
jgi:hypothetical protein